jgi:hypothetical protein
MTSAPLAGGALSGSIRTLKARSSSRRHRCPQAPHRTLPPPPARLRRLAPLASFIAAHDGNRLPPPRIIDRGRR